MSYTFTDDDNVPGEKYLNGRLLSRVVDNGDGTGTREVFADDGVTVDRTEPVPNLRSVKAPPLDTDQLEDFVAELLGMTLTELRTATPEVRRAAAATFRADARGQAGGGRP